MTALIVSVMFMMEGNVYTDAFDTANKAYESGDYATATQLYEKLVAEAVVSPEVFYNLGNAYYRSGRLGPAIANYERALQLEPSYENARQNLEKAVGDTERHLARPLPPEWEQSLLFWHYDVSPGATRFLAGFLWLVLWALLGIRQWRPLPYTRMAAVAVGVLALAFGASAWSKANPLLLAVANDARVPVHYGTNENETVHFELYAGDRVTVDKRTNGWSRVNTIDGERGWAQDAHLTFVGPPYVAPAPPVSGGDTSKSAAGPAGKTAAPAKAAPP